MDITEHAHQTVIKNPGWAGNNQGYDAQICWGLDCIDKVQQFGPATSICEAGVDFRKGDEGWNNEGGSDSGDEQMGTYHIHQTSTLLASIHPASNLVGPSWSPKSYFTLAKELLDGKYPHALQPYHTFAIPSTTFHLTHDPTFHYLSVDEASSQFGLSDLHPALADFLRWTANDGHKIPLPIGSHHTALPGSQLPFDFIQIWSKMQIQDHTYHMPNEVTEAWTVMAAPNSKEWLLRQFDIVIANMDSDHQWPQSGLTSKSCLLCYTFEN